MEDFYRKEREDIFLSRFEQNQDRWRLKSIPNANSAQIFIAKNYNGKKTFSVEVTKGVKTQVICSIVNRTSIKMEWPKNIKTLTEADIARIVKVKTDKSVEYLALKHMFVTHAKASTESLLISGCVENNFKNSKTYPGRKLCLTLKTRSPIQNPWVSGTEKEYFLVGNVEDIDCEVIKYFGKADEDLDIQIKPAIASVPEGWHSPEDLYESAMKAGSGIPLPKSIVKSLPLPVEDLRG
jgi:hypothetical protein